MNDRGRGARFAKVACVAFVTGLLLLGGLLLVGCDSGTQGKEKTFKADWTKIVSQFEQRVAQDDKKGQDLAAKQDIPGVINLTRARITNVEEVLGKLLLLYPPKDLQKLDVLGTYYLITLKDRLEGQISLYDAILNDRPTADLTTTLNQLVARNTTIG
ncbi:MAG: hypothetical protein ACYC99_08185, partial [Candidatus Geothermincolia bacterium]